jgi:hypothetical protein
MRKRILRFTLLNAALVLMLAGGSTAFVSAEHGGTGSSDSGSTTTSTDSSGSGDQNTDLVHGTSGSGRTTTSTTHTETGTENETETGDNSGSGDSDQSHSGRQLSQARLHVCENRQHVINNITSRIVKRGTNQLNLFTTIAQRVETFKTGHSLTVANYDQLVATLQTDQAKVTSDLATMKSNETLECSGNPQGVASSFQTALKQEISDLKTYKTDVKNLITAVKAAARASDSTDQSTAGGNQ